MKTYKFGFDNFEQAELFAKDHGGEVHSFRKRNGDWRHLDEGLVFEPYDLAEFYESKDDYYCYYPTYENEYDYFSEVVKNDVGECGCFSDAIGILDYHKEIWRILSECNENEFVLDTTGYLEKLPRRAMRFYYDVYCHEIGAIYEEE